MSKGQVVHLQHEMNAFISRNKSLGLTKVRVDGDKGRLTNALVREIKYLLGYSRKRMTPKVGKPFYHRMRHPNWIRKEWRATPLSVRRGKKRRRKKRKAVRRLAVQSFLKPGVGFFDGKPVAKTAIPILKWCRANGWHGVLVSGYRSPAYSEGLCYRMCGRPSCPGRCAGRATNHAYAIPSRFGIDVSDYANFGRIVSRCPIRPHIHNSLGSRDPVHFSPSGT